MATSAAPSMQQRRPRRHCCCLPVEVRVPGVASPCSRQTPAQALCRSSPSLFQQTMVSIWEALKEASLHICIAAGLTIVVERGGHKHLARSISSPGPNCIFGERESVAHSVRCKRITPHTLLETRDVVSTLSRASQTRAIGVGEGVVVVEGVQLRKGPDRPTKRCISPARAPQVQSLETQKLRRAHVKSAGSFDGYL